MFDLAKFKAGQPALTRRGEKRYFVALVPEMHDQFRLLARSGKGTVIYFYDEQGRIGNSRSMDDMDSMYEEQRQIDWSKIAGSSVPVKFQDSNVAFLKRFKPGDKLPFVNSFSYCVKEASLKTGLWVFNSHGENPWPDGVIIEVWVRPQRQITYPLINSVRAFSWDVDNPEHDIIASRCVGLEKGWRY